MRILVIFLFASLAGFEFEETGYVEIADERDVAFEDLYDCFDQMVEFLQREPVWGQKLYVAKERFIRTRERGLYSTDFFGLYEAGHQISFYYSSHFHESIRWTTPEIMRFLEACKEVQASYENLVDAVAMELGIEKPSILLKVIKYLPSYQASRPHYDGTAFSLFLHSTDNQSLLLAPYGREDFVSPLRGDHSVLLIPGTLLNGYNPTPHIVVTGGEVRYATIAFAMRPHFIPEKRSFYPLPNFPNGL